MADSDKVQITLSPEMSAELKRLKAIKGFGSTTRIFSRAITLLRLYCNMSSGSMMVIRSEDGEEKRIVLPEDL